MGFEAGEVLITDFIVAVGETPVIGCSECITWIVTNSRKIFENFAPDPVASERSELYVRRLVMRPCLRDEEVCCIKAL